jgi:hypothetical protein
LQASATKTSSVSLCLATFPLPDHFLHFPTKQPALHNASLTYSFEGCSGLHVNESQLNFDISFMNTNPSNCFIQSCPAKGALKQKGALSVIATSDSHGATITDLLSAHQGHSSNCSKISIFPQLSKPAILSLADAKLHLFSEGYLGMRFDENELIKSADLLERRACGNFFQSPPPI